MLAVKPWNPYRFPAGVVPAWYDAAFSTLGGTLNATGASPPVVTISGLLSSPQGIRVEITTSGTRGTAVFRVSIDNGSTWLASSVLTVATYAIGTTGITLNFPTGSYTDDNVYRATVQTIRERLHGRDLVQLTASKQGLFILRGQNGRPTVRLDGSDDIYGPTAFTLAQPWNLAMVYKCTLGASGVHDIVCDGNTAATGAILNNDSSGETWAMFAGATLSSNTAVAGSAFAQITATFAPTAVGRANGAQLFSGSAGASDPNGFTLGGLANGTRVAGVEFGEAVLTAGALSANNLALLERYLRRHWGTP